MRSLKVILITILVLSLHSCTDLLPFGDSNSSGMDEMNLREVAIAIDRQVGDAEAGHVSQCDILAIGAKPCGGPWGYLVYSKKTSDETLLKNLIERYDELDAIRNKKEGWLSTCEVAKAPNLILENGICKGNGPYAWNPGDILEINGIDD